MPEAKTAPAAPAAQTTEVGLLDQIVEQGRFGKDAPAKERGKDLVRQFVSEVLEGSITVGRDTEAMINARIAQLDHLISLQLNEVMHAPDFQKLEGTWRGLKYLLSQTETSTMLKIKVLNVSKKDLLRDLQRAPEFDQSALFKKVYEEEYGVFGGAPFGALLGDYEFGRGGQDIELLEKVSQVAAAAHAPFITGASTEMFNLESFAQLDQPRDLGKIFDNTEYAKWKAFRQTEDSRYVALTLPRMLLREPYGNATVPVEAFDYEEHVDGTEHDRYLWGNAAWALAARVNQAFAMYGWCACIRGVESGGLVEGLPVHNFRTDSGDVAMKCPTEVADHRPAREGACRPRLRAPGPLQGDAQRRVLQRAVGAEGQGLRQGRRHRQRPDLGAAAVHLRRLALRALPQDHDARQDRRVHVAHRGADVPQQLDRELRGRQ